MMVTVNTPKGIKERKISIVKGLRVIKVSNEYYTIKRGEGNLYHLDKKVLIIRKKRTISGEQAFEMRANFSKGTKMVNVLTGQRYTV